MSIQHVIPPGSRPGNTSGTMHTYARTKQSSSLGNKLIRNACRTLFGLCIGAT